MSLVQRIRAGDAAAEQELFQRFSQGVKAILRNAGADPSVVDDLHQETFRIALEKIRRGDLREAAGLSGLISSLSRNLATEHFRRGMRSASNDPATLELIESPQLSACASRQSACERSWTSSAPSATARSSAGSIFHRKTSSESAMTTALAACSSIGYFTGRASVTENCTNEY